MLEDYVYMIAVPMESCNNDWDSDTSGISKMFKGISNNAQRFCTSYMYPIYFIPVSCAANEAWYWPKLFLLSELICITSIGLPFYFQEDMVH